MAKFSVGIEEDGEGPSNRVPKRQRTVPVLVVPAQEESDRDEEYEDSEGEEEEYEGEEEASEGAEESEGEEELEESGAEQGAMSPQTTRDGSISVTLTDPEVLDCSICYEALTIPVFQCENGHIACSTCCIKIRNRCPSCASPIGYNRCRAIEKVLESVRVSCYNMKYGCKEAFSYNMKQKHEKACPFMPCSCPLPDCSFEGSSADLCTHFGNIHKYLATSFRRNLSVSVTLRVSEKFVVLREEKDGSLFILDNKVETLGNVVTLSRVGPSMERSYYYELSVKSPTDVSVLKLQSFTKSTPKRVDSPQSLGFLLVPSQFSVLSRQITMDVCVWYSERSSSLPRINNELRF